MTYFTFFDFRNPKSSITWSYETGLSYIASRCRCGSFSVPALCLGFFFSSRAVHSSASWDGDTNVGIPSSSSSSRHSGH